MATVDRSLHSSEYFWGVPTCYNDSAEPNYFYSSFFGELVCTISILPWLAFGYLQFATHKGLSVRVCYIFHLLAAVAGFAYHTTLYRSAQVLDRGIVLCWMVCLAYQLREYNIGSRPNSIAYTLFTSVCTLVAIRYDDVHFFAFMVALGTSVYNAHQVGKRYPMYKSIWDHGLHSAIVALAIFKADDVIISSFHHFHSVWHIASLYATSLMMLFVSAVEAARQGNRVVVKTFWGYPYALEKKLVY
eukprot:GILK01010751.1.p1 GENE.GILK01010751.1~~GILK01010751.1.p1  ORF type:complete len:257 (+),score=16.02 GILK01010751.1:37-771(+)